MNKHPYFKCAFSIILLFSSACAHQDLLSEVRQMRSKLDEMERYLLDNQLERAKKSEPVAKVSKIGIKTSVDKDFVIIDLSVPEIFPDGVEINAKGGLLDGVIKLASGGFVNLKIQDGRYFEISSRQEASNSDEKKGFKSFMATSFVEAISLPEPVDNLESSQVTSANGIVQIKLPRAGAKSSWKKLSVTNSEASKKSSIKNID